MRIDQAALSLLIIASSATAMGAQESHSCPMHAGHQQNSTPDETDRSASLNERGDHVMGFDHSLTTHHFLLSKSGGSIEVSANDGADAASLRSIRGHLSHITQMFAAGDFEVPMLVHGQTPPGVTVMQSRKSFIRWKYQETAKGARVVATTKDREARDAIHEFLRFQIEEHQTGDPLNLDGSRPGS